ncbi:hypothetical protein [Runella sp.]|uniref:hypothetical protein n=1 Tax=Runella sp. TaxID=1960881 RepID=UPI003D13D272
MKEEFGELNVGYTFRRDGLYYVRVTKAVEGGFKLHEARFHDIKNASEILQREFGIEITKIVHI